MQAEAAMGACMSLASYSTAQLETEILRRKGVAGMHKALAGLRDSWELQE